MWIDKNGNIRTVQDELNDIIMKDKLGLFREQRLDWWLKDATGEGETEIYFNSELLDENGDPLKYIQEFFGNRLYTKNKIL